MKRTSRIDADQIIAEIRSVVMGINDPRTDGYVGKGLKQDLHRIKIYMDEAYASLPVYGDESEWDQSETETIKS
jgi:hypothetical protein